MIALLGLAVSILAGCGGNGTQISDRETCDVWLHGNGRDRYLAARGFPEYDAGFTGRRPDPTLQVGALMDQFCKDEPRLPIKDALRLSAARAGGIAAPPAQPEQPTTDTPRER